MSAIATLDNTRSVSGAGRGRTYSRTYVIIDAATEALALSASGLPAINDGFPGLPDYKAKAPSLRSTGPTTWEATIDYAIPENGDIHIEPPTDPQVDPPKVSITPSLREIPTDVDVNGIPIRNAANFPHDQQATLPVIVDVIKVTRYEAAYDVSRVRAYRNKTNANAFNFLGNLIRTGDMLCRSIRLVGEYPINATGPVLIEYEFEWWSDERVAEGTAAYPHDLHIANVGIMGWYDDAGAKKSGPIGFQSSAGIFTPTSSPVALTLAGRPINPPSVTYQIGAARSDGNLKGETPIDAPVDDGATESPISETNYRIRLFKRYGSVNFSGLGIF
jgi:hypothetical protein